MGCAGTTNTPIRGAQGRTPVVNTPDMDSREERVQEALGSAAATIITWIAASVTDARSPLTGLEITSLSNYPGKVGYARVRLTNDDGATVSVTVETVRAPKAGGAAVRPTEEWIDGLQADS